MAIDIRNKTKVQKSSRLAPHLLTKSRSSRRHQESSTPHKQQKPKTSKLVVTIDVSPLNLK